MFASDSSVDTYVERLGGPVVDRMTNDGEEGLHHAGSS